ncbi:MAG: hypothetical protein JNM70_02965 [Anaerolineae bacterium]|nr:hypothetical protein [Anaerolineae bacterium]
MKLWNNRTVLFITFVLTLALPGLLVAQGPITVTNVTPLEVPVGQGGTFIITGTNFAATTQVSLSPAGGGSALPLAVTVISPTEIQAPFPNTLTVGQWIISVSDSVVGGSNTAYTLTVLPPAIVVTGTSPSQITSGQSGILTITGANFRPSTGARLIGVAALSVSYISPNELRAAIPSNLAVGQYIIEVSDPLGGSSSSFTLTVVSPPPPTVEPIPPTAAPPPTDIPGAPNLLVRSFSANPSTIRPGGTTTFTIEIVNQGSRPALGISITVDSGGKFVPASGISAITIPDLAVGGSVTTSLSVVAASDTPGGPQTVGITLAFRDFSGQTYTNQRTLTVNVEAVPQSSQITLSRYQFNPSPVIPGQPVTITILLTNTGNETASQVLVQVAADGILLAGPQGSSFPVGDIRAGASASIDMPLIVSKTAKDGPQSQSISITFLQKGETKNVTGSMTVDVAKVDTPAPVMVIDSYDAGAESLQPGQQFTLTMTIKNIGSDDAKGLLVTFGQVDSSGGGIDPTPGATSSTSTTANSNFAPLGSGGTIFVGDVIAGEDGATITQDFIVNGSVDSGVYSLPVTLRYQRSDGSASQDRQGVSLVVIVPPQIRITQINPLPESANAGEPIVLSMEIANRGRKPVNFTTAAVSIDNGIIVSGEETYLGPVQSSDTTTLDASVLPSAEGTATITVTFNYTDDLNRPKQLVETYTVEIMPPLPTPDFSIPPPDNGGGLPTEPEAVNGRDLLGRLLLGLLGLGS